MHGIHIPLVTPFTHDGQVDTKCLDRLARHCVEHGADGLVALATTGEAGLLTPAEQRTVLEVCRAVSIEHGVPLTVGAGTMGTEESIRQARERAIFADALLLVVPYYLRPTDEGIIDHFIAIGAAVDIPLVPYNIPYRTGKNLSSEALRELVSMDHVTAMKHCSGGVDDDTLDLMSSGAAAKVLCGDDAYLYPLLQLGAGGGITASASLAPAAYTALYDAVRSGNTPRARALHNALLPLVNILFSEPSPAVLKAALASEGIIDHPKVRAPLHEPRPASVAQALAVARTL